MNSRGNAKQGCMRNVVVVKGRNRAGQEGEGGRGREEQRRRETAEGEGKKLGKRGISEGEGRRTKGLVKKGRAGGGERVKGEGRAEERRVKGKREGRNRRGRMGKDYGLLHDLMEGRETARGSNRILFLCLLLTLNTKVALAKAICVGCYGCGF